MYVVKKNIYAERNSQKAILLHNIVNPSKHQDRPNVGAVPGQRRRHGPTLNQHRVDTRTNAGPPSTTLAQHRLKMYIYRPNMIYRPS